MISIDWSEYDIVHCGISGGKDSQAAATWLVQDSGCPVEKIRLSFNDTGNEHEITYNHIHQESQWFGLEIEWLKPDLDFYQLAAKKGRFPSTKMRFCTQYLKMEITQAKVLGWMQEGKSVLLITGVRHAESMQRAKLPKFEFDTYYACDVYRPLISWTTEQVFEYLKSKGQYPNPLYSYGARRVGCLPCIMSRKSEIRMIADNFPERIDMIREQESFIGNGGASFFPRTHVPKRFRNKTFIGKNGKVWKVASIDDVVRWSMTKSQGRGKGREFEHGPQESFSFYEDAPTCINNSGLCE